MNKEELERLAKGVFDPVMKWKLWWDEEPKSRKAMLAKRKEVRRSIFHIRKNIRAGEEIEDPKLLALKEIIDQQIEPNLGQTYETFSISWDIHPNKPSEIVIEDRWFIEGGGVDPEFGKMKDPTAFTKQE